MSEEEKATAIFVEDYDLPLNWKKWEEICDKFPLDNYLMFEQEDEEDNKFALIYFVNIASTVQLLKEHYSIFVQETGIEFDPEQVVFEMQDKTPFWNKVQDSSILVGLLYGFGLENVYGFYNKYKDGTGDPSTSRFSNDSISIYGTASIDQLPLPMFATFAEKKDAVIERYKKERKKIQKIYKNRDFVNLTLQKLTQK